MYYFLLEGLHLGEVLNKKYVMICHLKKKTGGVVVWSSIEAKFIAFYEALT